LIEREGESGRRHGRRVATARICKSSQRVAELPCLPKNAAPSARLSFVAHSVGASLHPASQHPARRARTGRLLRASQSRRQRGLLSAGSNCSRKSLLGCFQPAPIFAATPNLRPPAPEGDFLRSSHPAQKCLTLANNKRLSSENGSQTQTHRPQARRAAAQNGDKQRLQTHSAQAETGRWKSSLFAGAYQNGVVATR